MCMVLSCSEGVIYISARIQEHTYTRFTVVINLSYALKYKMHRSYVFHATRLPAKKWE